MSQKISRYFLAGLILLSAILAMLRFNSLQIGTSYDDAHYIILAESLASGQGYELINFPHPQIERSFPPGWPILLTPLTYLFPGNYQILKLFSLLLWLASILLIYKILSNRIASPQLEIVAALIAINPLLVGSSVTVMSESAYLFFSMLTLSVFDMCAKSSGKKTDWLLLLACTLALYSQFIRTIGISLSLGVILYLLLSRRFREAGIVAGIFIVGILIQTWVNFKNGGSIISSGYQSQVFRGSIAEKVGQIWSNGLGYFNEVLSGALLPIFSTKFAAYGFGFLPIILNVGIILFIVIGFYITAKSIRFMDLYFLIYMLGILAFWNPDVGSVKARFLIPMIPLLYLYLFEGVDWVSTRAFRSRINFKSCVEAGMVAVIAIVLLTRNIQDWRSPVMNQTTDLSIGSSWIANHAPADAIVMVNEPVPYYVQVRRKTINYPNAGQELESYLDNQGIEYIIVAPKLQSPRSTALGATIENDILPILKAQPDKFIVVFSDKKDNVTVYQYLGGE